VSVPAYIAVLGLLAGCATGPAEDATGPEAGNAEPARGPFRSGDPEIDRALQDLGSDDFATYAAAAHRLVVMGETAIPALGRAADERENPDAAAVLRAILMRAEPARVGAWFEAPWATVRAEAARAAGERRLTQHAPALVGLLEDGVASVRRAAVAALRRLSSRFFGFEPEAPAAAREKALGRWKEFWGVPPDLGPSPRVSYDGGVKLDAAQWRQVLDQLEHGICLLDRDGVVRWANAALRSASSRMGSKRFWARLRSGVGVVSRASRPWRRRSTGRRRPPARSIAGAWPSSPASRFPTACTSTARWCGPTSARPRSRCSRSRM